MLSFVGWFVPSIILALIPKCPACVAGYALFGSSVGFSLSASSQLRTALVILCAASLSFLTARYLLQAITRVAVKTRS